MEATLNQIAFFAFDELSEKTQQFLSPEKMACAIAHRFNYLSSLTYKQKMWLSTSREVEVVQKRMERSGHFLPKSLIRLAFKAEEQCYQKLNPWT